MSTVDEFSAPAPIGDDEPVYDRNGVRRSKDGRPYVKRLCPNSYEGAWADHRLYGTEQPDPWREDWCEAGRVPGKREGTTKQCPTCKGQGEPPGTKEVLYSRCTSFVGALEDRQNLEAWMKRTVIIGLAAEFRSKPPEVESLAYVAAHTDPEDRDALDALADVAFTLGEGYVKAQKGTDLHELTERVDTGQPLGDVSVEDRRDMAAYVRAGRAFGLRHLDMETFVVCDRYKIGGTYDRRVISLDPRMLCEVCDAEVDDVQAVKPKVLDLKTGRIDYGAGKMCQQIAVYANSEGYDPASGKRLPHDVCTHKGFVLHLPQGTGTATMHSLDLTLGWEAVHLSSLVREHRRVSKTWMTPLDSGIEFTS